MLLGKSSGSGIVWDYPPGSGIVKKREVTAKVRYLEVVLYTRRRASVARIPDRMGYPLHLILHRGLRYRYTRTAHRLQGVRQSPDRYLHRHGLIDILIHTDSSF